MFFFFFVFNTAVAAGRQAVVELSYLRLFSGRGGITKAAHICL